MSFKARNLDQCWGHLGTLYILGVWDSLYVFKTDPGFLFRVMWAKKPFHGNLPAAAQAS